MENRDLPIILKCRLCKWRVSLGSDAFVVTLEALLAAGRFDKELSDSDPFRKGELREMYESSAGSEKNPDHVFPRDDHYANGAPFKVREIQDSQIANIKHKIIKDLDRYWKCSKCDALNRYKKTIVRTKESFDPRWWRFW